MRINPKVFSLANGVEPFEVQEFDGRKVELFYMDDFPEVKEEYINKSQFSVWSSEDGFNYRLFLEKGYYETIKDLYEQPVNKIWVDFWDATEKITKKTTRYILIPLMVICVGLCIGSFWMPQVGTYITIGVLVAAFIAMIGVNSYNRRKIMAENVKSRNLIIEHMGQNKFDSILEAQKNYIDQYYAALYPEDSEEELDENEVKEESEEVNAKDDEVVDLTDDEKKTQEEAKEEAKEETKEEKQDALVEDVKEEEKDN